MASRNAPGDPRPSPHLAEAASTVVELRRYALLPGRRDVLIELFDREFVETQEAVGMTVIGQFRDRDRPDRFVWLRGFPDMAARKAALEAFYGGRVWRAHRAAANATMIDSDDVHLLRPVDPSAGPLLPGGRPPPGSGCPGDDVVAATICYLDPEVAGDFPGFFEREVEPVLAAVGAATLGRFVTDPSANTFPALPVRAGETVFAWLSAFADLEAAEPLIGSEGGTVRWRGEIAAALARHAIHKVDVHRLTPTARSRRIA